MSTTKPTLYIAYPSGPCRSILLALKKAGKLDQVEIKEANPLAGETKTPEFLAINPFHSIPALEHNGLCLYESTAILEYLCEIFEMHGEYGMPKDVTAKYKTINMLHKYHNFTVPGQRNIMMPLYATLIHGADFDLEALKAGLEKTKAEQYQQLEAILTKNGGFVAGSAPTVADIHMWVDLNQITKFDAPADDMTTLHIYDFDEYPAVQQWIKAVKAAVYDEELCGTTRPMVGMFVGKVGNSFRLLDQQ